MLLSRFSFLGRVRLWRFSSFTRQRHILYLKPPPSGTRRQGHQWVNTQLQPAAHEATTASNRLFCGLPGRSCPFARLGGPITDLQPLALDPGVCADQWGISGLKLCVVCQPVVDIREINSSPLPAKRSSRPPTPHRWYAGGPARENHHGWAAERFNHAGRQHLRQYSRSKHRSNSDRGRVSRLRPGDQRLE